MKQSVVIVGAGGHGREVLEIVLEMPELELLGFIDDNEHLKDKLVAGYPVLGNLSWLQSAARHAGVVCALGSPQVTKRVCEALKESGLRFINAISPSAKVSSRALLGQGVMIFPGVIVNVGATIHDHVTLNVGVTVSHDSVVGAYSNINPGAHLAGNVTIGEGAYIGMGSNLIQNVRVGDWSIVGAGSVVNRDIPPHVTAFGVPAKVRS